MPATRRPKPTGLKAAARKQGAEALGKLARAHAEAALQALAEIAAKGNSEASRVSAATALLDRGYGKSGTALGGDGSAVAPTLYQRIELIDGIEDKSGEDHSASRE